MHSCNLSIRKVFNNINITVKQTSMNFTYLNKECVIAIVKYNHMNHSMSITVHAIFHWQHATCTVSYNTTWNDQVQDVTL